MVFNVMEYCSMLSNSIRYYSVSLDIIRYVRFNLTQYYSIFHAAMYDEQKEHVRASKTEKVSNVHHNTSSRLKNVFRAIRLAGERSCMRERQPSLVLCLRNMRA